MNDKDNLRPARDGEGGPPHYHEPNDRPVVSRPDAAEAANDATVGNNSNEEVEPLSVPIAPEIAPAAKAPMDDAPAAFALPVDVVTAPPEQEVARDSEQELPVLLDPRQLMRAAARVELPLWRGFRRGKISVVIGAPGVGKSLYVLQALIAMATGVKFCGRGASGVYRVVLLSPEDDAGDIGQRMAAIAQKMGVDAELLQENFRVVNCENPFVLFAKQNDDLVQTAEGRELFEKIKAFGADVVCLDPMAELHHLQESDNGHMHFMMAGLREIARQSNCAMIVLHHLAKASGDHEPTLNSIRGAGSIGAALRYTEALGELTDKEASEFGLSEDDRIDYVRLTIPKWTGSRRPRRPIYLRRVTISVDGFEAPAFEMVELVANKQLAVKKKP